MSNRTRLTLAWTCAIIILMSVFQCDAKAEDNDQTLQALLKQIDAKLYDQSESDVRKLLDATIEKHWSRQGHKLAVNWDTGGLGCLAGMWFRSWEMLGEKKYREAGLDFADAVIQTQHDNGLFSSHTKLVRKGKSTKGLVATLEDEYHFGQFAVLAYAYKISGDEKYLRAVVKHADVIRAIQDPAENKVWLGPWPHSYGGKDAKPQRNQARVTGYVLNDYATYDGIRTMLMTYHLTKEKKYIDRLRLLPGYMLYSNVGQGNVRGWRGQTDAWNNTGWERQFEGPLIDPRNFNRFACPKLLYFAAVTGDAVYANMVRETYDWLRSVEQPKGWFYKYTYDGRACDCMGFRHRLMSEGHLGHYTSATRRKVHLESVAQALGVIDKGGIKGLRKWYGPRPVKYDADQYLAARIAAARRVTDENLTVRLWSLDKHEAVAGKFLQRVRQRPLRRSSLGYGDGYLWSWWRTDTLGPVPYRGWAAWQYVWDVRVAQGRIDADTAAWGGRGLEACGAPTRFAPEWEMIGDWSTKAVEVEDWAAIPLNPPIVKVKSVQLDPSSVTLKPGESRQIKVAIAPDDATCKSGVWTSSNPDVATAQPHMLDKIDSSKVRPSYRREGKILIHAGRPKDLPAKTTITFTSTDGHHAARCEVAVQ